MQDKKLINIDELTEHERQYRRIAIQWFAHAHPQLPAWKVVKMVDAEVAEKVKALKESAE